MKSSLAGIAVVGLLLGAATASAQRVAQVGVHRENAAAPLAAQPWSFGPVKPHLVDATKRTGLALVGGALLMGIGLGVDQLNASQCAGSICSRRHTVQTGIVFAFLGSVAAGTAPQYSSKCNRSGRAVFGMLGAAVGVTAASVILDVPLMNAGSVERATVKTMGTGLLGLAIGTGTFSAIC